ncbi:MAG: hypothetical protein ABIH49_00895 [archaeon]
MGDEYQEKVIQRGDECSALIAKICSPTLKNSRHVEVVSEGMNGISVLRIPKNQLVVVHSAGGNPQENDVRKYASSLVDRLVSASEDIGATPVGFANVIDASEINPELVKNIGNSLVERANHFGLAILNGELAGLGNRVTVPANLSGTMISIIPLNWTAQDLCEEDKTLGAFKLINKTGIFTNGKTNYAIFDPDGNAVYVGSDGTGTKPEFAERSGNLYLPLRDSLVMKTDDKAKLGAIVRVVSDVVETRGINLEDSSFKFAIEEEAKILGHALDIDYIVQCEDVRERIRSYKKGIKTINISGSAVSTIDESTLRNPPKPSAGEYLITIRGKPNPRSNGITDKRRIMIEWLGLEWHTTDTGREFLEFLQEPSTMFYLLFRKLRENNLATSFYHMSGGAFNGKLARPLAKYGIFARLENLFPADWRENIFVERGHILPEIARAKWPMGNEGFVTTQFPERTLDYIKNYGLEGRIVGQLEIAKDGRTGVELVGIKSSDGTDIYYPGN